MQEQTPMLIAKMHGSVDTLLIDKKNFDRVILFTYDYEKLVIYNTDLVNAHYTVRFYPTDNVYVFDKYHFKVKSNKLVGYRNKNEQTIYLENKGDTRLRFRHNWSSERIILMKAHITPRIPIVFACRLINHRLHTRSCRSQT